MMAERSNHQNQTALLVRCGAEFFLVDVGRVRRMEDDLAIHPSPFSARGFLGMARFGGEPLTVFSLEALAGGEPCVLRDRMTVVVVDIGGSDPPQRLGLAVDEALEIVSLGETDPEEARDEVVSAPFDFVGRQVRWFNVDALDDQGKVGRCPGDTQEKEGRIDV